MKSASTPYILVASGFALTISLGAYADSVDPYTVNKVHLYTQTSTAGAVALSDYPYALSVRASSAVDLHLPNGTTQSLATDSNGKFTLTKVFTSKANLDAAFPNGTYTLTGAAVPTLSYNLTTDSYPSSIPQITGGTWTNGVLVVNPAQSTTVNYSTFTTFATSGLAGHVSLSLDTDASNLQQQVVSQPILGLPVASAPFTSVTIPANTLSTGKVYRLRLNFDTITTLDLSSLPGNGAIAIWQNDLEVWVAAVSGTAPAAPVVTTQPTDQSVAVGSTVTFTAGVNYNGGQLNGTHIAWYVNGLELNVPGNDPKYTVNFNGSAQTLTVHNVGAADAGAYYLKFIGTGGMVATNPATLTVITPTAPSIVTQPQPVTVATGSSAILFASASGTTPLAYQWFKNGTLLGGATSAQLWIPQAGTTDSTNYSVRVTNSVGTVTSNAAALNVVTTADPGRLINLSVLTPLGAGETMTVGTVLGPGKPATTRPVLIRAAGPSLLPFGVTNYLADPQVTVHSNGAVIASNDNWNGDPSLAASFVQTGAFSYTGSISKDAAVYLPNAGGDNYTAEVTDTHNESGTVIAEIYDGAPSTYAAAGLRLINVSVLKQIATGDTLTAGFVISGSTAKTVLVRAIGPGIAVAPFNVPNTMTDPQLTLFNGNSVAIDANDNWGGSATLVTAIAAVGAFPVANLASTDAMLLVTLPPGNYTAQVQGAAKAGGNVIVEVYDVP